MTAPPPGQAGGGQRIAASWSPGEMRAVLIEAGRIVDYAITRPGAPDGVGDLHRGRIIAQAPALGGAFVALDGGDGFLPDTAGAKGAPEGTLLGLLVTRAAQGSKGRRVTAKLDEADAILAADGPVRLVRRGPCAVVRLARLAPDAPVLVDDAALLASLRPALGGRLSLDAHAFSPAVEERLAALEEAGCTLAPGVAATITPTPALVAIDLDSSGARAQDAANRAAMAPLAAELRLRNLSGAILVDFAGLSPKRRRALGPALAAALASDPLGPRLLGFTTLGLAEILRARVHPPLHETMAGPHAAGLKALRHAWREQRANPGRRYALYAAPAILAALLADRGAMEALAGRMGRPLRLRELPGAAAPGGPGAAAPGRPGAAEAKTRGSDACDWMVESDDG